MIRVYWNIAADAPLVWSVDRGAIASVVNVVAVIIQDYVPHRTVHCTENEWPQPKGWMEYGDAEVAIKNDVAVIRRKR